MKRKIKFSFMWQHEKTKEWMELFYTLDQVIAGDPYDDMSDSAMLRPYHHKHTREYTGLKDKNGKEIYEGDILRSDVHIVTVVYTAESASFDLKTIKKGLMGMAGVNSILEIIGNIYENPELIEARDIEVAAPQSEVEAEKTLRFLKTGRQHD